MTDVKQKEAAFSNMCNIIRSVDKKEDVTIIGTLVMSVVIDGASLARIEQIREVGSGFVKLKKDGKS